MMIRGRGSRRKRTTAYQPWRRARISSSRPRCSPAFILSCWLTSWWGWAKEQNVAKVSQTERRTYQRCCMERVFVASTNFGNDSHCYAPTAKKTLSEGEEKTRSKNSTQQARNWMLTTRIQCCWLRWSRCYSFSDCVGVVCWLRDFSFFDLALCDVF